MIKKSLAVLALMVVGASAHAQMTGEKLLQSCTPTTGGSGVCDVYINGFVSGFIWAEYFHEKSLDTKPSICRPSQLSNKQVIDSVKLYIASSPAMKNALAEIAISSAMSSLYPCGK